MKKRGRPRKLATPRGIYDVFQGRDADIARFAATHSTEDAAREYGVTARRVQQIIASVREAQLLYPEIAKGMKLIRERYPDLPPEPPLPRDFKPPPRHLVQQWEQQERAFIRLFSMCQHWQRRALKAEAQVKRLQTRVAADAVASSYNGKSRPRSEAK